MKGKAKKKIANQENLSKFFVMIMFLIIDLGLNSTVDYAYFDSTTVILALSGFHVVVELSIFITLFLAMADTFLFRVGLLGLLIKKFKTVLIVHPIYVTMTIVCGALKLSLFNEGKNISELWTDSGFAFASHFQKISK
jgi:hypothetical protein